MACNKEQAIKNLGKYAKKGAVPWIKGKKHSEKTRRKIGKKVSKANIGREVSEKTRNKISDSLKNHPCYKDTGRRKKERLDVSDKGKEIINLYCNQEKGVRKIAELMKCDFSVIKRILKENSIRIRSQKFYVAGEKNYGWNNGSSFEPYGIEFNKQLKKFIKERDGCCMLCKVGFEDLKLLKRRIHIHHINYDKQCNFSQNLISLCNKCHTKTNVDREIWTKHFQSLLKERYDYQYSEKGEIVLELNNFKEKLK